MSAMLIARACVIGLLVSGGLTACSSVSSDLTIDRPAESTIFGSLPAEKPLEMGKKYYRNGDFGLAEQSFRKAVEEDKNNAEAWLGLAASYDRLRRFDQASRAYEVLIKLAGRTPVVLNNLGYHYILQGEYAKAQQALLEAKRSDPGNKFIRNNIDLIENRDQSDRAQRDG